MDTPAHLQVQNTLLKIKGSLYFNNVGNIYEQGLKFLTQHPHWQIDLAEAQCLDSSGLALLLSWKKTVLKQHGTIQFLNVPHQLKTLAQIAGLETILLL